MVKPVTVERYPSGLVIKMDDGSRYRALETSGDLWIVGSNQVVPAPPAVPTTRFIWPFSLDLVTSEFGPRDDRLHAGIDFGRGEANMPGTAIIAASSGVVIVANKTNSHGGYGNTVVLDHGGGLCTLYAHIRFRADGSADVDVSEGDNVVQGQRLGGVGQTGASSGNHLHFETHEGGYRWYESARDPREFIPKWNSV